jgi:hypothetical protein
MCLNKWAGKQFNCHPVRSAYQPPASSTFLSERISHQQPAATNQQYSSLRINQHQPSAFARDLSLTASENWQTDVAVRIQDPCQS